jgi:hypothetical protein
MTKEEKILLGLALVGLVAIVIFQRPQLTTVPALANSDPVSEIGLSMTPANDSVVQGRQYLTYNAPFFFAPPVSNFLPSITAGIGSQTVNSPTNFADDNSCGCM